MESKLALYYFDECPYCQRVLKTIKKLNLNIELLNVKFEVKHRQDLLTHGGSSTVPCLRITNSDKVTYLYESLDIVEYLETHFSKTI